MENRPFGKTGHDVSALGFGGAEVGYLETEQRQVAQVLNTLLDEGVNLIDTAAAYAGSEEVIGKAIAHRRDEYVLVSKCGRPFEDLPGEAWSPDLVSATVDRSLRRLQTDRLDVMLLHSCDLEILKKGDALGALVKAREAGKIRFVGYSGDNEAAVHAAGLPDVAVIETSVSICDQANIDGVLPLAARNGIGVLAKRPIANAAWKDVSERRGIYVNYAKTYAAPPGRHGPRARRPGLRRRPRRGVARDRAPLHLGPARGHHGHHRHHQRWSRAPQHRDRRPGAAARRRHGQDPRGLPPRRTGGWRGVAGADIGASLQFVVAGLVPATHGAVNA